MSCCFLKINSKKSNLVVSFSTYITYNHILKTNQMKKLVFVLLSIFLFTTLSAQNDKRLKGIEKELNSILEITKTAGFAVAIVEGDKIIYAKGFGYKDYENKIPVDANTLFAIGSSTKAFTSSILGVLRADDKLSFNDNPRQYITDLEFFNDDMNNNIIIKDLMRHSTGLPRHDWSWYLFPTHNKDSLIQRIKYQEPFTGIRQQWYYNNFGFLAQGIIAEKITGKSWEENINDLFFKPIGMSRSNTSIEEMKSASNASLGYELKKDGKISKMDYYDIAGMSPAGSINSSVNDMSKWLITWINKGKFNDKEIIPETYVNEAISSQMVLSGRIPDDEFPDMHLANYGYGWIISSYRGHYRVEHGGNIDGFSANVAFFPTDSIGVVVLANQNGSAVPTLVRNTVADRMLKTNKTDWAKRFKERQKKGEKEQEEVKEKSEKSNVKNTKPSHVLQDYTGSYSNLGYGSFDIKAKNDSLFAYFKLKTAYLKHYHYDVFDIYEITKTGIDTTNAGLIKANFSTNDAGDISNLKMKMEQALDHSIKFKRKPNTIEVDSETLKKYTGDFELASTPIKIYIKKEKLYLFVSGQPEYELLATDKHKFVFKVLDGYKVEFVESEDGSFNLITLIQPNGTFKVKRKE